MPEIVYNLHLVSYMAKWREDGVQHGWLVLYLIR